MALDTFIDTEQTTERTRRIFATEFKQHLVELCLQPDTSVAKVAMQHQINANLLHKWIRQSRSMVPALKSPPSPQTDFLLRHRWWRCFLSDWSRVKNDGKKVGLWTGWAF